MWTIAWAQQSTAPTTGPAPGPVGPMGGGGGSIMLLLMFVAIFYFLIIRPNQKKEKERQRMLSSLAKGDRVVTSGGILGTIVGLSDKTAVVRVNDDPPQKIEFVRGAISRVVTREDDNLESS